MMGLIVGECRSVLVGDDGPVERVIGLVVQPDLYIVARVTRAVLHSAGGIYWDEVRWLSTGVDVPDEVAREWFAFGWVEKAKAAAPAKKR